MKKTKLFSAIVLFCILAGGGLMFWYAKGNTALQLTIGVMTAVAYVLWGLIHHAIVGDFHRKVVIEYVLVGMIAIVLLATLAL
ncbi:MAG TPA: hypothetical protein VJB96_01335 [Patescibacteria group bacterium]|nr:hypothetical protein [Patescibacteria group bacterium]